MKLFWIIFAGVFTAALVPAAMVAGTAISSGARGPILVTCAIGIALGTVLAWGVARKVSVPLSQFDSFARTIARGQFGVQVAHKGDDELGELANTLNYMSASVEAYSAETQRLYEDVESGYLETIVALANSLDSKDAYTRGHSQRVSDLAVSVGQEMGLCAAELKELKYGGILHDIGKIGVVEAILHKQSRLTDAEMTIMREHPAIGDRIINPVRFLSRIRPAVRNHHERWDGTGYPDKMKGEEIPIVARIVNAADTWDACTSTRPYQSALPFDEAVKVMDNLTGTQLDPKVASALKTVVNRRHAEKLASAEPGKKIGLRGESAGSTA